MLKKKLILILTMILLSAILIKADMAPPPGYRQVSQNLVIETKDDFSDYRFFFDFYGDLREVSIKSNEQTTIKPMGGGVRYSSGTLWAIPKKSLNTNEDIEKLSQALTANKIVGAVKLIQFQFSITAPDSEIGTIQNPPYLLERETEKSLKMTPLGNIEKKGGHGSGIDIAVYGISKSLTPIGYLVLIGFPLILIGFGIWFFRKRSGN